MAKVKLTDRSVQSAKAVPGQRLELFDQKTIGLILRVSESGMKSWAVRYRTIDGQQRRHAIGRYPEVDLADAREKAIAVLRDARSGKDPTADKAAQKREARAQPLKTMLSLKDAYFASCESGEWQPRRKKKRASTLAEEKGLWRRHISSQLDDLRVEEVTKDVVRKLLRTLVSAGHGTTSNRTRALIRQVFNFAIAEERIDANPVDKVRPMAAEVPRERVLAEKELLLLWSALSSRKSLAKPGKDGKPITVRISEAVSIALKVQAMTLTRRAEVSGMRRDELDLDNGAWVVGSGRTKNGTALAIALPSPTVGLIRRAIDIADAGKDKPSPFVFPSPRDREKPITPESLSHALRDLGLAIELKDVRTHDLRRTGASMMASERLGITPFIIGRLLNHSSETGGAATVTLKHYALHDYASEKRQALEAWVALLREIVGEEERSAKVVPFRGAA